MVDDVRELARLLVDNQEAVAVSGIHPPEGRRDRGSILELRVAPDDLGKVIGRQGRTARALRTLLETRGDRRGERYELDILED
ncbi:MAG: KH domain-containing protein [Acidobacteria bacterium]|nr:KH domain-containing protein [Acidobacteriota bacterium]